MPPTKIEDGRLLERLTRVFRLHGYDGASLTRIAKATGLGRASLYHRFAGGKEEMAEAVLTRADRWFETHVLAPLSVPGEPAERARTMARRLADFYGDGRRSCLLDTLSLGDSEDALRRHIERSFRAWIEALASLAREAGATGPVAKRKAEEVVIRVQGALVLSRATGDVAPFKRVLAEVPDLLTRHPKEL